MRVNLEMLRLKRDDRQNGGENITEKSGTGQPVFFVAQKGGLEGAFLAVIY